MAEPKFTPEEIAALVALGSGGGTQQPSPKQLIHHSDGTAWWVDTRTLEETPAPDYNDPTKAAGYQAPGRAPSVSVITPAQQVTLANPGSAASVTEDDLRRAGFSESPDQPGYWIKRGADGVTRAFERRRSPDGSYGFDDVSTRDYKYLNPQAEAAATSKVSPSVTAANQLVETQRILQGGQKESAPAETTSQAAQSPVLSGNYDPSAMGGGSQWASTSQPIRGPVSALGQPGEVVGVNIPTPGGSRMYTVEQAMQDLRAAGIIPTGSRDQILAAGSGINAKRANMLAEPGADPLSVQTQLDALNRGTDVYSRAKAVAAEENAAQAAVSGGRLPAFGTDTLTAANLRDYITPQTEEIPQYAEGGSITVGMEDDPIPAGERSVSRGTAAMDTGPRILSDGSIMRTRNGEDMFRPSTGGSWQNLAESTMPSWQDYIQQFWNNWEASPSSSIYDEQQSTFQRMVEGWQKKYGVAGGGVDFGPNGPMVWQGTYRGRPQTFNFTGFSRGPRSIGIGSFAQGGSISAGGPMQVGGQPQMVTDEPIVGIGMQSRQPRFTVGEPNALTGRPTREVLSGGNGTMNVTPLEPSVPIMQAPVPQGSTDPRIMSLFAQTAAQRMRPRVPIP